MSKDAQAAAGQTLPEAGQFLAAVEQTRPRTGLGLVSVSFGLIETPKLAVSKDTLGSTAERLSSNL